MATDNGKPRLDQLAEQLEAKLQAIRQIQKILAEHPDLADELAPSAAAHPEAARPPTQPRRQTTPASHKSQAERVAEYLLAHGNRAQTVLEIQKGAGIPRNSVNYVVYTSRPSHFEKIKGDGDNMKWRLSAAGLAAYKAPAAGAAGETSRSPLETLPCATPDE